MAAFNSVTLNLRSTNTVVYTVPSTRPVLITNLVASNNTNKRFDIRFNLWKVNGSSIYYLIKDNIIYADPNIVNDFPLKSHVLLPNDVIYATAFGSEYIPFFTGSSSWELFNWNTFLWDFLPNSTANAVSLDVSLSLYET